MAFAVSDEKELETPHKTSNCFVRGFCLHKNSAGYGKTAQGWGRIGRSQKISIGGQTAAKFFKKQLTTPGCADIINHVVRHGTNIWGISSAGRALAWHARGHRFDPGILHQKALYFVGSMVLFFLLKPIFGGCIASPAPFSGFCRRFLYNPQLLTLHRFQKKNVCRPVFQQAAASSPSMYGVCGLLDG